MVKKFKPAQILIVTGPRGAGKTTFSRFLIDAARAAGWQVGGVLSPGVFDHRQKGGIEAENLRSGERRRLAWRRGQVTTGPHTEGWSFDGDVLAWGNAALAAATPCDLLIVDELGPLELERDEGWQAGLAALDTAAYRLGVVVIRPELLAIATGRWPAAKIIVINTVEHAQAEAGRLAQRYNL